MSHRIAGGKIVGCFGKKINWNVLEITVGNRRQSDIEV